MSDFSHYLYNLAHNYGCPRDIPSIKNSFKKKLQERLGIRFIEPTFDYYSGLFSLPHPSGKEKMFNWLIDSSYGNLNTQEMANMIIDQNQFLPQTTLTTHPSLKMKMYLESLGSPYYTQYKKGHEFKHSLIYSLPYNIAYIYGLKQFNNKNASWNESGYSDTIKKFLLSHEINNWLDLKENSNYSMRDFLYGDVRDFNQKLDDAENETNLLYHCSDMEEPLLDAYNFYIGQMQ